jgi:hypothetical protein
LTLLFLAALGAGVVLFVLFPVFARATEVSELPTADAQEQKSLTEKKERIYEAIKDADFEYQAGKLSEADYRSMRADFLSQAAETIARLDDLGQPPAPSREAAPPRQAESPEVPSGPTCSSCEQSNPPEAQFCYRCGAGIAIPADCPQCGAELQKEARFCTECGVAIPA